MFGENLKTIRKSKGYTQEELAVRLHVVRQTVSKWEKGLSVPDADMLIQIAELLETSVSSLLGTAVEDVPEEKDIAVQLSRINEQLAVKNRRIKLVLKVILYVIAGFVAITILNFVAFLH